MLEAFLALAVGCGILAALWLIGGYLWILIGPQPPEYKIARRYSHPFDLKRFMGMK